MRYLLLTIAFFGVTICLYPNNPGNYFFSRVNVDNGLSHNTVKAVIQDSYGFMWFGTRNKLSRYDGTSVKIFDCNDPIAQKSNNNICSLFEDESKQLWVGTDKGVFTYDPIKEKFTFFDKKSKKGIQPNDWVSSIQTDNNRNIWIVVPNQGVFRYSIDDSKLHHYLIGSPDSPNQGNAQCMVIEKNGRIWIGTNGGGVYLYNKEKDSFAQFLGDKDGDSLKGADIYTICDYGDELLIGIHEGKLRKLNKKRNTLSDVNAPEVHYKIIRDIVCLNDEIWVGTSNGLFIINEMTGKVTNIKEDPMDNKSLSDNMIHKIYKDKEDGIWITTNYGGVNYLSNSGIKFNRFIPLNHRNSISSKQIGQLIEDNEGNIWIATEDSGVDIYNPKSGEFKRVGRDIGRPLYYQKIVSLYHDENQVWIGYFKNGLDIVQLPAFSISHYSGEVLGLSEPSIYAICEDHLGRIWIGNGWEIYVGDKKTKKFDVQALARYSYIHDIAEDPEGYIWVATMGNGVFKYNLDTGKTDHFKHDPSDSTSLSSNSVGDITIDSSGKVWFSTDRGGICCYNRDTHNFTSFSIKDGLPDDVAYKILEDKNHNLWFGTNNGLVKLNPQTKDIHVFKQSDGLPGNQFNYKSALASNSGLFYFGGLNGLVSFDPYEYKTNTIVPPVYITKLTVFNKEINVNSAGSPLEKSIIHTQDITLKHDQSNLRFDFVALSYTAPDANKYAYKMEGIDSDWVYTNENHSISYAKLPPGKYTFKVKGSNNDGMWNNDPAYINIEILPPWWQSTAAYFIYFCLFLCAVSYWFYWYNKKQDKRNKEKQRVFEAEKEKELYSSKVEFFTNIAHEIRTPVTLINGPLESLLEMDIADNEIRKNLQIMGKNTSELLILINQLLDFRKVDNNKFLLTYTDVNIAETLQDVYLRFESSAIKQNKQIKKILPDKDLHAPVDREAFIKILSNLFSNAVRYSKEYIEYELGSDEKYLILRFSNDGQLIPDDLSEKIFDPFYQLEKDRNINASSGIGLSLARSLAEQHKGMLYYEVYSGMNTFILKLPLIQENVEKIVIDEDYIVEDEETNYEKHNKETILIVEDNPEMLSFLGGKLQNRFDVEMASNGIEALDRLNEKRVDIIVTDVMMPDMDGFELCEKIKSNIEFSHIPIVLLTAKNDLDSKIKGLKAGADAYVEKPFSFNYLLSQLDTLLNNRQREKKAFMQKPFLAIQQMGMNKADEQFMNKVIEIIHENITDTNFNVERLADLVYMSRSSLHRKIKALSGLAPTDFMRLIKLKRAAEIILEGNYHIGEVCYLVGINSPSYFIKIFSKQFGMTPKEFRNQNNSPK